MPSLNRKDLQGIFRQWEIFSIFIETGTNEGITAFEMAPCFKEVHTVEICETLHAKALEKSKNLGGNAMKITELKEPTVDYGCYKIYAIALISNE